MSKTWKEELGDRITNELGEEIDIYETQMELKRQDKITNEIFGETRLRRGVYGQRYDNGQRFDGVRTQELAYQEGLTKGVNTVWDAPGMQRIKIPFGGVTANQLEVLADLAEEYADNILHITTRQDIQLHYVHIADTPARRAATPSATSRPALCPVSVRPSHSTSHLTRTPSPSSSWATPTARTSGANSRSHFPDAITKRAVSSPCTISAA